MGEIAEYLINGDDDCITGEYLGPGGGFPRTNVGKFTNKEHPYYNPILGVDKYINSRIDFSDKGTHRTNKIIKRYARQVLFLDTKDFTIRQICTVIQKDFDKFKTWFKTNY